jgi:LPXTG-motif cell wall-anchored protein
MFTLLWRARAVVVLSIGALLCALMLAGPAAASGTSPAYPPPPPASSATCAATSVGGAHIGSPGCADAAVTHRGQVDSGHSVTGSGSGLASTGFDVAMTSVLVLALLGVGGLCLLAGRRRRHS